MTASYRRHFDDPDAAAIYELQYSHYSYSGLLWELEQAQLMRLVTELRTTRPRLDYLDFACGTGRVISFLEAHVDSAIGIEISPWMAKRAQAAVRNATILCADITTEDHRIERRYDLITAFRFVLNAEPSLRLAGLKALRARLKDDSSMLIFNNHGNIFSHKAILWPYHRLRKGMGGHRMKGNYLSNLTVHRLAKAAGLRIEAVYGAGLFGGKVAKLAPERLLNWAERQAASARMLRPILVNQMYVARRL